MKAFIGYSVNILHKYTAETVGLSVYTEPDVIAGFVSFLIARCVGRGHILKHLSVARKVNSFLMTGMLRMLYMRRTSAE